MSKRGTITDHNIEMVLHRGVRVLDLSECEVSDDALAVIARYGTNIRKIDLNAGKASRTNITSSGIQALASGCPHLQVLFLRRCVNVDDDAVAAIARNCRHLRELNIGGCKLVTDQSLKALGEGCNQLTSINFAHAQVTDEGIIALVSGACAQTLKEIQLVGCREVTDDAIEAVIMYCPKISILLFHDCPKLTEISRRALEDLRSEDHKMKQVTWTVY